MTADAQSGFTRFRSGLPGRSCRHRILGGVCGGLAEAWGTRPAYVRLVTLALALLPGPIWIAYVAAWILMPLDDAG